MDDFASAVAARATALRRDAGAKKAQKKKAFADLLRALPKLGVRSARRAVPDAEREPQAWFREPPVFAPDCFRRQHHSEESDELSEEELEGAAALRRFDEAEAYYFRSMAKAQRLRSARGAAHGDVSRREVDAACGSVDHLLHLLRRQRRVVAEAAAAEAALTRRWVALEGVLRDAKRHAEENATNANDANDANDASAPGADRFHAATVLPPQRQTRLWTLRQRALLTGWRRRRRTRRWRTKPRAARSRRGAQPGAGAEVNAAATLADARDAVRDARARLDPFLRPILLCDEDDDDVDMDADADADRGGASTKRSADEKNACRGLERSAAERGGWALRHAPATRELRDVVVANFATLRRVAASVSRATEAAERSASAAGLANAEALPGWRPARAILREAASDADAFDAGDLPDEDEKKTRPKKKRTTGAKKRWRWTREERPPETAATTTARRRRAAEAVAASAARFSAAVESAVAASLVWAQGVKAATDGETVETVETVSGGEAAREEREEDRSDSDSDAVPTMTGAEAALSARSARPRLRRVAAVRASAPAALAEMTDAVAPLDDFLPLRAAKEPPRSHRSRGVRSRGRARRAARLSRAAARSALVEYVEFHRASAKLESVLASLYVGVCAEGFCAPPPASAEGEEDGGEGDGRMMDDVAGTGMGEGEGKKDVSDEIEDEEQILGAEDGEKDEKDDDRRDGPKDKSRGIEMQNDFEADANALSDDEEDEEDDEGDEEGDEEAIDKEMGDGEDDENAEVVDEKMWDAEDDEEERERGEDEAKKQDKYEKGSTMKREQGMDLETRAADDDDPEEEDKAKDDPANEEEEEEEEPKAKGGEEEDREERKGPDEAAPSDDDEGPRDPNDGVNQEEIEENHGIAPKGPEGGEEEDGEAEDMELPDDLDPDGDALDDEAAAAATTTTTTTTA